ncbi:hypothetical protein HKD37_06G016103 [Glycine soja]
MNSGFYHDPNAGWYYSSKDGCKFEDGNYVLLGSNKDDNVETYPCDETTTENPQQIYDGNNDEDHPSFLESKYETHQQAGTLVDEAPAINPCKLVIDLYLSGYKNVEVSEADAVTVPFETDDRYNSLAADAYSKTYEVEGEWIPEPGDENGLADDIRSTVDEGIPYSNTYELEEGEWIPDMEDEYGIADRTILLDEEKWRAQYGQVAESGKDLVSEVPIVDLWDWEMVTGSKRDGKDKVARLVGRLAKPSAKQLPSIPSRGGKLRSAPICEAHLDLDECTDCEILAQNVTSLSTYDSSNPTEHWDFPQLSPYRKITHHSKSSESSASASVETPIEKDLSASPSQLSASKKIKHQYRDRTAERRILHGGFGMGPGQKNLPDIYNTPSSPVDDCLQEATAEALEVSFGAGSCARKLLKSMGWKEGEGLGGTYSTSWKRWYFWFGMVSLNLAVASHCQIGLPRSDNCQFFNAFIQRKPCSIVNTVRKYTLSNHAHELY